MKKLVVELLQTKATGKISEIFTNAVFDTKLLFLLQKFDSELGMRMELAVTNERGKWEEQSRRAWQEQEQSLLTTAHQEWSRAQESVLKAEVERARREWERQAEKTNQVLVTCSLWANVPCVEH